MSEYDEYVAFKLASNQGLEEQLPNLTDQQVAAIQQSTIALLKKIEERLRRE